jgi:5-hydroxyisourate hydrolase-like protein (transthyretin family)
MLLCNFASFAEQPPPAQNSTDDASRLCTLSGTVVSANTGEPIKKAKVLIRDREKHDRNQAYTAFTDAEGRFTIGQVPAGSYEMGAERTMKRRTTARRPLEVAERFLRWQTVKI